MSSEVFIELALVIAVASAVSIIMRLLRQPLIMGYIISGILVGPSLLNLINSREAFDTFSEIGITLLLFIIGLELSLVTIARLGKPVFLTALAILGVVGGLGVLISQAFGFSSPEAIIIGLALFFSSTIIIAKMLSDKKQLSQLNGQIAIGIVIVDDIVATFALLFVTTDAGPLTPGSIALLIAKGALSLGLLLLVGAKLMPRLIKFTAKSQELLFISALAWGFGVAALFEWVGFSVEVGALFAGMALAHLPYAKQIGSKLKPLRDFFIILFFITLGEALQIEQISTIIVPALVLSAIVIILKPIITMICLGLMRYTRRTSFLTGLNLSQISEFSVILAVLALSSGVIGNQAAALITVIALITIAISTYLMQYDDWLFQKLSPRLHLFERGIINEKAYHANSYPFVLLGYLNGGNRFVKAFKAMKKDYVVVDYNPDVIDGLEADGINYLYGDAADHELLAELDFDNAELIINTISDQAVNRSVLSYIRQRNKKAIIVSYCSEHHLAAELYELGASYVLLPNAISSENLVSFLKSHGVDKRSFDALRQQSVDGGPMLSMF